MSDYKEAKELAEQFLKIETIPNARKNLSRCYLELLKQHNEMLEALVSIASFSSIYSENQVYVKHWYEQSHLNCAETLAFDKRLAREVLERIAELE